MSFVVVVVHLGGGFKNIVFFPSLFGEDEPNLTISYFSNGLVQPPTSHPLIKSHSSLVDVKPNPHGGPREILGEFGLACDQIL